MKGKGRFAVQMAALLGLFLMQGGCASTPARRARGMPHVIEALPEEDQARILSGNIALGDTQDMVYLAWGRPDRRSLTTLRDDETETWIYFGYRSEFVDTHPRWVPADRWVYDRRTGRYIRARHSYLDFPETVTYRIPYEQRRVLFRDDAVIAIEQVR